MPVSSGRASLVSWPLTSGPVLPATSSLTLTSTGVAGGVISTVRTYSPESGLTLPAVSVAMAVKRCSPSASTVVGVKLQMPLALASTVPSRRLPS
ncbi:hypothetical protein BZY71_21580 [Leclercia adecarboxylata]|nr:hypothetical protein BZY71_21580 [Leclercia adecarboxylata]